MGGSTLDSLLQSFLALGVMAYVVAILFLMALLALVYFVNSYTILSTGRKCGLKTDWMAFVPVVQDLYILKYVNEPWWKIFFIRSNGFGYGVTCLSLFGLLLTSIFSKGGGIPAVTGIMIILGIVYLGFYFYFTWIYYSKLYTKFNFNSLLS